jgi:glycosyltransferase involved in cell wall biosynthesis
MSSKAPSPSDPTRIIPRVSILLPVHNAQHTLDICLESLFRQRESDWECVAVDDGSSDESAARLAHAAATDTRFRVVRTPHAGIVSALNSGLPECRAPYIARMDADDVMHRERLGLQCDRLDREPALAAVGCHVRLFPRDEITPGRRTYENWLNSISTPEQVEAESLVECPLAHPSLLIRRSVLERFGYRDFDGPEDYDLVLRLLRAGESLAVVPRRLLAWRDHALRLSRTNPRYALARFTACKAEHIARHVLGDDTEYILWGYGKTGRALRKALLVHDKRPSSIVELHPRRIGQRIHGAPVVSPDALRDRVQHKIVVSVSGLGPRTEIRAALGEMGYSEPRDFVCAA